MDRFKKEALTRKLFGIHPFRLKSTETTRDNNRSKRFHTQMSKWVGRKFDQDQKMKTD